MVVSLLERETDKFGYKILTVSTKVSVQKFL